jgi:hypothetical protein
VVPDPEWSEWVRAPRLQLETFYRKGHYEGDCDDAATFAAAILAACQIPASFVAYRFGSNPEFEHVNVEAWPGIQIDPIVSAEQLPITPHSIETMVLEIL